ncbi:MAG: imidazoleglycerol-phosphate dehydratase HisB [Lentisphaeria bacterium]|nr:imidazoleglycerol-phosphate dehydratase HisB [Lentisphaeria bacterium]
MSKRTYTIQRDTQETQIGLTINLDGEGKSNISTGIPFLDHMLTLFTKHGYFDLEIKAVGDLEIDQHHTMEDLGLTMGKAIREALGDKKGIRRYGFFYLPMEESLSRVVLDLSGRPCLVYNVEPPVTHINNIDVRLFHEFFQALTNTLGVNLHIDLIRGRETHHIYESIFKGFGRALDQAVSNEPRETGVPSTKGLLD